MMDKKIKICMFIIGLLDLIIGARLVLYCGNLLTHFILHPKEMESFVIGPLIASPFFISIGFFIFWAGIQSLRLKTSARKYNLIIYSWGLYLSVPIGLLFAILARAEPLFKRILCIVPALVCLLIILFLTRPRIKEQFK
ncbi:MAG: hypothetical protein PHC54_04210 [Candidatus Omnitrophica bacterium]|nr:hypothetical protein [Candidatus Omnitrophota bacterium]MDD5592497.1 hypothetical protein [Candidatus Omnitrophota bacterium]